MVEGVYILHNNCLWCEADKRVLVCLYDLYCQRSGLNIHSKQNRQDHSCRLDGYSSRSRSAEVSQVMQGFLRFFLSEGAADITGSISGKVKYFSNAELSFHEAFRKHGHVPLEDRTKNALKQHICLLYQAGTIILR